MTRWTFTSISFPLSSFDRFWLDFHENGRQNLSEEYVILISNQLLFTSKTKVRQKFFSFHVIFRSLGVNQTAQWIVSNIWGLGGVDQTPQWIVSNIGTGGSRSNRTMDFEQYLGTRGSWSNRPMDCKQYFGTGQFNTFHTTDFFYIPWKHQKMRASENEISFNHEVADVSFTDWEFMRWFQ